MVGVVAGIQCGFHARNAHGEIEGLARSVDVVVARLERVSPEARLGAAWWIHRQATRAGSLAAEDRDRLLNALGDALTREQDARVRVAMVSTLVTTDQPSRARWLDALRLAVRQGVLPPTLGAMGLRAAGGDVTRGEELSQLVEAARAGGGVLSPGPSSEVAIRSLAELPPSWFHQLAGGGRRPGLEEYVVMRAIGARGDPRYAPRVRDTLESGVRSTGLSPVPAALGAVESLGLVELAPQVLALARSATDVTVRRAATRALGALGGAFDSAALDALIEDPWTREPAFEAVGRLGDVARVPALVPWLSAVAPGDRVRAARALGRIGGAASVAALVARAQNEGDLEVRAALWDAVGQIGDESTAALTAASTDPAARVAWMRAVMAGARAPRGAVVGDDEAAVWLRAAGGDDVDLAGLRAEDLARRMATARAMTARTASDAGPLADALRVESNESVRALLVMALGRATKGPDADVARRALAGVVARESEAPTVVALVAWVASTDAGVAPAPAPWLRALNHGDPRMRQVAAWAAGRLGDASMRATLERAMWCEVDPTVRGTLAVALASTSGESATDALAMASRTAWTAPLIDRVRYAQALARSSRRAVDDGAQVVVRHGAPAGSVWCAEQPDGGWRVGVATMDGDVLMAGATSADTTARRLDAR